MTDYENIPEELRDRDQWLLWDSSSDTPRRPHWRGDFSISWSDPAEWQPFEAAVEAADGVESWGIGYVTAADNPDHPHGVYGVIDIDGAGDEEGNPKDWVPSLQPFFDHDAYLEWSPSRREEGKDSGIHIPVVGVDIPEWWSDSHLDDHEGIDVLAHKFCTFTGDVMRGCDSEEVVAWGEWTVDWLHEAYQSITGEDPLAERDTALADATNDDAPDEEWLTEEVAEQALDHINPDCEYSTWKDIGMALVNHFGKSAGRRLFESWSRGGSKWDSDAERQAERIVSDADNYNFAAPTLVHHAKHAGWSPSDAARDQLSTASDGGTTPASSPETDATGGPTIDNGPTLTPHDVLLKAVNDPYHPMDYNDDGAIDGTLRDLQNSEKAEYAWQLAQETGRDDIFALFKGPVYAYDDGVWSDDDRDCLRQIGRQALATQFSTGIVDELELRVRTDNTKYQDDLGAPDGTIATESGLLELLDRSVEDLKPDHYALSKIPTEFDPDAECPQFREFIQDSVDDEEHRKKLQEYAGYCLWHHEQPFGKALFLVGPTDSGKGTAIKAIQNVLGKDNTAAEPLSELIDSRWGKAQLVGKLANIQNEVSPKGLSSVEQFKTLTGGEDEVDAEFKGKDKFKFTVTQKFVFATNEVPSIEKAGEAFYNRLLFVEFPHTVPADQQDKELGDKLADEDSGILNWMLEGLERLLAQGRFTGERSINGKKKICDAFGGVIDRFTHNCLMVTGDSDDKVVKSDLEELARKYADDIDRDPEWDSQSGFSRKMTNQIGVGQGQKRIDGDNNRVFTGVRIKPETVYEYNMGDMLAVTGDDGGDGQNTGLNEYGEEVRKGFDFRQDDDSEPAPEGNDGGDGDDLNEAADADDESELEGEPLAPHILQYVRENSGAEDVPREELVGHLVDRGAAEKQIGHWIEKCLERGDIATGDSDDEFRA
jgi:putative DNA primase/helicase